MSQTYFSHNLEDRYTWFNGDMSTKKVLDYILVEAYTQQFMKECKVSIESDFDSDHRLVMAQLETPTTKKARRKFTKSSKPKSSKIDPGCLKDTQIKTQFINSLSNELNRRPLLGNPDEKGTKLIECLQSVASTTLKNKFNE